MPATTTTAPRILILRLSALGDILHALPLLGALRTHWPAAHLGWLCEPGGAPLLAGHPLLDRLHVFPKREWRAGKWAALRGPLPALRAELCAEQYEIALDVQGLTKSAAWGWLAGAPRRIGLASPDSRELAPWLATQRVRPAAEARHVIERNLALLGPLGVPVVRPDGLHVATPVHLPAAAQARAAELLQLPAGGVEGAVAPLAVFSLGAGWATKIWAPQRFGELARRLADAGWRVALAWGPGEQPLVDAAWPVAQAHAGGGAPASAPDFAAHTVGTAPGVYVLPATSFIELGAVIARAGLFVGGDTGPTHFAAALGVPTASMMGPLDARRNGPYGPQCRTVQHGVPRRAPCWRNHRRWCDPATDLRHVTVEDLWAVCRELLHGSL